MTKDAQIIIKSLRDVGGLFAHEQGGRHLIDDVHALRIRTQQAQPGSPTSF